jgi:hypothetical protein
LISSRIQSNSFGVIFPPSLATDVQIGAEGAHGVELLFRERIRRDRREAIPLHRAHQRQRRAGAPSGEFDDAHAGTKGAAGFGPFDHRERHAVLVRAGRVVVLQLHHNLGAAGLDDVSQAHHGRRADRVQN